MKCKNILEAVGHTPLVRLNRINKGLKPQIYVKAEFTNPGGSVKDRIGISMIDEAEKKGLLKPGGTIIEGTSGNTGMGPALVAAVRGYRSVFTTTDKQSKEKVPNVKIIGVDPYGSLYYDFVKTGQTIKAKTYVVEGIGEDFFPTTMNLKILDDIIQVNDEECFVVARRLAKMEGLFTGGSGGGCISGTLRLAKDLGKNDFVVALLPDTGTRYLSKVYNDLWMHERGYVDAATAITAAEVVNAKHASGKVRELIIARPYQTVFHALKTMQEQDISQIPVFEENLPIGTIYEDQILNLALQGKDLRKLVVREVMSNPLPQVSRTAPVERVTQILSHENPAVFVEMGDSRFEILTKYDLMSTVASL